MSYHLRFNARGSTLTKRPGISFSAITNLVRPSTFESSPLPRVRKLPSQLQSCGADLIRQAIPKTSMAFCFDGPTQNRR